MWEMPCGRCRRCGRKRSIVRLKHEQGWSVAVIIPQLAFRVFRYFVLLFPFLCFIYISVFSLLLSLTTYVSHKSTHFSIVLVITTYYFRFVNVPLLRTCNLSHTHIHGQDYQDISRPYRRSPTPIRLGTWNTNSTNNHSIRVPSVRGEHNSVQPPT